MLDYVSVLDIDLTRPPPSAGHNNLFLLKTRVVLSTELKAEKKDNKNWTGLVAAL